MLLELAAGNVRRRSSCKRCPNRRRPVGVRRNASVRQLADCGVATNRRTTAIPAATGPIFTVVLALATAIAALLRTRTIITTTLAIPAIVVVPAHFWTAMMRTGAVLAAAFPSETVLIMLTELLTAIYRAGAVATTAIAS